MNHYVKEAFPNFKNYKVTIWSLHDFNNYTIKTNDK